MDKRLALFLSLSLAVLAGNALVSSWLAPKPDPRAAAAAAKLAKKDKEAKPDQKPVEAAKPQAEDRAEKPAAPVVAPPVEKRPDVPQSWQTLGSADPNSSYRMAVTLTNRGAAVETIEMNSPRYRDLDDRSGYVGFLAAKTAADGGALVNAVAEGTPAAQAGLKTGDVIRSIDASPVTSAASLEALLQATKPGQVIALGVQREGNEQKLGATLIRRPLAVVRPEKQLEKDGKPLPQGADAYDPLSFLLTMQRIGDDKLAEGAAELKGVDMLRGTWDVVESDQTKVRFRMPLDAYGLEVFKTYRVAVVPAEEGANVDYPAYGLTYDIEIHNLGGEKRAIAYRQEGPNGLPIEGAWYANKMGRTAMFGDAAGMRGVVVKFSGRAVTMIACSTIAGDKALPVGGGVPLDYAAVDAQYFAVAMLPRNQQAEEPWFDGLLPVRVGAVPADGQKRLTNCSFRLESSVTDLEPDERLIRSFTVFAGPKRPGLLAQYGNGTTTLNDLVYYGWYWFVAIPMLQILHGFYYVVRNYGIAIIMLTVVVRGAMFPLSRRQARSAQKMQELQPEMKRINEKYKGNLEQLRKAQQELFRKHNYQPLGGCLLVFIQLPIFVGLYRSLMVDVELRDAPLFGESINWASNLAAPDMFWNWEAVMPDFITHGTGFLSLGPYLNIFPLITIALFIWQQKMFMPPAADEQAALQQKLMQYMTIFFGIMFFKVASGLCLYFIASSIWGITERKMLPKSPVPGTPTASDVPALPGGANGTARGKKKQREPK